MCLNSIFASKRLNLSLRIFDITSVSKLIRRCIHQRICTHMSSKKSVGNTKIKLLSLQKAIKNLKFHFEPPRVNTFIPIFIRPASDNSLFFNYSLNKASIQFKTPSSSLLIITVFAAFLTRGLAFAIAKE